MVAAPVEPYACVARAGKRVVRDIAIGSRRGFIHYARGKARDVAVLHRGVEAIRIDAYGGSAAVGDAVALAIYHDVVRSNCQAEVRANADGACKVVVFAGRGNRLAAGSDRSICEYRAAEREKDESYAKCY